MDTKVHEPVYGPLTSPIACLQIEHLPRLSLCPICSDGDQETGLADADSTVGIALSEAISLPASTPSSGW